ncbi:sensor histidine kinase [Roseateles sp. BYS78W]|uniref:histidine kinase n=1 Tax=Pelomonas candidula TaxID=3299025 RepID=A0ABW7HJC7_9BURK
MRSIERVLLAWIMAALAIGAAMIVLVVYLVTLEEMNEVFDADLKNVATGLARFQQANPPPTPLASAEPSDNEAGDTEETEIVTFAWDAAGHLLYSSNRAIPMHFIATEGLSQEQLDGEAWVVYTARHGSGLAQAAQRVTSRLEMAQESATRILPPMLLLALGIGALLIFSLRRGLRPLDAAARDVAGRSARSLAPIASDNLPRELAPMVQSINGLMARLDDSLTAQRRFLADAAHELRSPVTALRLQLQLLRRSPDDAGRTAAMDELQQGMARAQRLIEQLLQFARTEPEAQLAPMVALDLADIVREVVEGLNLKAEALQIDLGAELHGPVPAVGDRAQLVVLLNNLVENALRHTPAGGFVDVGAEVRDAQALLFVRDTGPGIPHEARERVFDRFYRGDPPSPSARTTDGSGLGLSIVKAIADRHGATVRLLDRPAGTGLEVRVVFPTPNDQQGP